MNKHTPKPWEIDGQTIYGSGKNPFICHWSGTIFDAYLIAAAPELLEVAEELLQIVKSTGYNCQIPANHSIKTVENFQEKMKEYEDVISKAKGEVLEIGGICYGNRS